MDTKRLMASWNRICPGCNIARKYPDSAIGKMVRAHWEKGCPCHDAYVELFEKGKSESAKRPHT